MAFPLSQLRAHSSPTSPPVCTAARVCNYSGNVSRNSLVFDNTEQYNQVVWSVWSVWNLRQSNGSGQPFRYRIVFLGPNCIEVAVESANFLWIRFANLEIGAVFHWERLRNFNLKLKFNHSEYLSCRTNIQVNYITHVQRLQHFMKPGECEPFGF